MHSQLLCEPWDEEPQVHKALGLLPGWEREHEQAAATVSTIPAPKQTPPVPDYWLNFIAVLLAILFRQQTDLSSIDSPFLQAG